MSFDEFWFNSMDEVLLRIQGKVNEWRVFRVGFYQTFCINLEPKDRPKITDFMGLPFDDEIEDKGEYDLISEYKRLSESGAL